MKFQPKTEKEIAEAGLFPKGEYDFEIVEATDTQSKAGNDMIELRVRVFNADGGYVSVRDWLVDTDGGAYKIRHCAYALGLGVEYEAGELQASQMVGGVGRCKIIIKKDAKGEYPDKNAIADYLPPKDAGNGTTQQTADNFKRNDLDDEIPF